MVFVFWLYSVFGQNHLYVRMPQTGIPLFKSEVRRNSSSLSAVRTIMPSRLDAYCSCSIRPDEVPYRPDTVSPASFVRTMCSFRPDLFTVSRSVCASLLLFGRFSSTSGSYTVLERFSDSFQVPRKERSINRPDDVISRPDAYLHKARIAVQI
jgi:predicted LPLAT superfamily acyltransferase